MGKDAWCVDMAKQVGLAWANRRPVGQQEAGTESRCDTGRPRVDVSCDRNEIPDARLIQSGKAAKGSDAYAGAGWPCPEYPGFRPSAQQFLVLVRNERFITPENRMTAPAPDSSFSGADIEHVSGHFV